jgi:hypothetical protein
MLLSVKHSATGVILRVKLLNSSVTTGAGLTGLTYTSSGLVISAIADNEATTVTYAQGSSNIEDITTLGTYAAPTTNKCRFKAVDGTNHPGVYEIQLANGRFSVSGARSLLVSVRGATNLAECDFVIQLNDLNEAADALLARDMSAVAGESARSPLNALRFLRNKWSISGGTLTVYEEDDTTSAWTAALTTNAAADPVTVSDPS